jgi:hypothetical protein
VFGEFDSIIEEIVDHLLELDLVYLDKSYISIEFRAKGSIWIYMREKFNLMRKETNKFYILSEEIHSMSIIVFDSKELGQESTSSYELCT